MVRKKKVKVKSRKEELEKILAAEENLKALGKAYIEYRELKK